MRRLIGLFVGILLSISSFGQKSCLPDSIISKIVDELVVKDHLEFVISLQDSTLKVYHHSDSLQREELKSYKIMWSNDELIISDLKITVKLQEDQIRLLKQEARKERWRNFASFLKGVGIGLSVSILYLVLHSLH